MATDANAERLRLPCGSPKGAQPADSEPAGKGTAPSNPGKRRPGGRKSQDPARLPTQTSAAANTLPAIYQPVAVPPSVSEPAEKKSSEPAANEIKALEIEEVAPLVACAQQGDHEAFHRLYLHFVGRVYKSFIVQGFTREEVQDLTNETFTRVVRSFAKPEPQPKPEKFIPWLYKIAENLATDSIRRNLRLRDRFGNRTAGDVSEIVHPRLTVPSHENEVTDNLANQEMITRAINTLNKEQKQVTVYVMAGLSNAEIAAALNRSVGSVKKLWERARRNLREELLQYLNHEE